MLKGRFPEGVSNIFWRIRQGSLISPWRIFPHVWVETEKMDEKKKTLPSKNYFYLFFLLTYNLCPTKTMTTKFKLMVQSLELAGGSAQIINNQIKITYIL
jgi:hypothetical protein